MESGEVILKPPCACVFISSHWWSLLAHFAVVRNSQVIEYSYRFSSFSSSSYTLPPLLSIAPSSSGTGSTILFVMGRTADFPA